MIKWLVLLLVSFQASADWYVKENSPICLSYEALKIVHRNIAGLQLNEYEQIKMDNDCSFVNDEMFALPQSMGDYSKVELMRYDGKRKNYYIKYSKLDKKIAR